MTEEINAMYEKLAVEIEAQLQLLAGSAAASTFSEHIASLQGLLKLLKSYAQSRDNSMSAVSIIQKVRAHLHAFCLLDVCTSLSSL